MREHIHVIPLHEIQSRSTTFKWQKADCGCLRPDRGEGRAAGVGGPSRGTEMLVSPLGMGYVDVHQHQNPLDWAHKTGALYMVGK